MIAVLTAAGVAAPTARIFAPLLVGLLPAFGIDTPRRYAAFVAQAAHESGGFTRLVEGLHYTTVERLRAVFGKRIAGREAGLLRNAEKLGNAVYAGRNGNGDEASGDGFRFRGRGLFQLTGRRNYERIGARLGQPYAEKPDLVSQPEHAIRTAAQFFVDAGCVPAADRGDIDSVTRRVNGPKMLAADERRQNFEHALAALATYPFPRADVVASAASSAARS